jgi:hypothetical protein
MTVTYPDSGNGEVVITSDPNESPYPRAKMITLTSVNTPVINRSITITQPAAP